MYKQVRHMTGALLSIGQGKLQLSFLQELLDIGNSQPPGTYMGLRGRAGVDCFCGCVLA
jgi:tRNA U38,U39,U40 pseudouridine synthase TruA